jgi:hypothetical protein
VPEVVDRGVTGFIVEDMPHCQAGVIYHFDRIPFFRMPTVGPSPGSQVMCHSSDALSFIPARADGCLFKYRVDLASDATWPGMLASVPAWDVRASPPAWWPCDEQGELRQDSGMLPPAAPAQAQCEGLDQVVLTHTAPPERSAIRCESSVELSYVPPWSAQPARVWWKAAPSYRRA